MRVRERVKTRVCSYCRDDLDDALATRCADPHCGALYHEECWEECADHHGSCAILGCGSARATSATPEEAETPFADTSFSENPLLTALVLVATLCAFGVQLGCIIFLFVTGGDALLLAPVLLAILVAIGFVAVRVFLFGPRRGLTFFGHSLAERWQ